MCISIEKINCSNEDYRLRKYKDILDFLKSKSVPEKEKIIDEIQFNEWMREYDKSEVVKNSV